MQIDLPDKTQSFYARLAGLMYLLNYLTSVFGSIAPMWIAGSGDFTQRAQRVVVFEQLYRTALVSMTIGWILIVFLAFSLYVTLKSVNKRLAQLALFVEICQASIGAVTVMLSFATLWLYTATPALELQPLVTVTQKAAGSGVRVRRVVHCECRYSALPSVRTYPAYRMGADGCGRGRNRFLADDSWHSSE